MKFFTKISAAALLVLAAACTPKADYVTFPYATLDVFSASVKEDVGKLTIPVSTRNLGDATETAVTVKVINETAVEGKDFKLNTPVLNFTGDDVKNIEIEIINHAGVFTGDMTFVVSLAGATNDVELGAANALRVKIADNDHPLGHLFGDYTMKGVTYSDSKSMIYASWPMTITEYKNDVTRVWLSSITPIVKYWGNYLDGNVNVYGIVNDAKDTITIPLPQSGTAHCDYMFTGLPFSDDPWTTFLWDGTNPNGEFKTEEGEIVFELQEDGSWTTSTPYGVSGKKYITTDTEWFYYYMNVYSSFNAGYPTVFSK